MSNILKQYRVAGEDKNVRVINSNSMIKQIFADSISRPADSYTGISSDAQSSLEKTKSLSPDTQESCFNDGINAAVVTEIDVSAEKERLLEEAKLEADSILDKAKAEAARLLDEAKQRAQILYADNKSKGYEDGLAECQREFDEKEISLRQELSDKESALKSKYDAYSKELESDLIDAIIQVFNKSGTMQQDTKPDMKQMTGIDISGIIKTQPASAAPASKAGATATTGTAAAVSVKASDAAFGTPAGSSANADVINHTHEILKLYKSGKSNVEIAKLLSLGTGEVKLIIDLYKEGK